MNAHAQISSADQERINAYWAKVRAGLHVSEQHDFGADPAQRIRANRTKAQHHIEAAGRLMREVDELLEADWSTYSGDKP